MRQAPGEASAVCSPPDSVGQEPAATRDSAPRSSVWFPQTRGGRFDTKGAPCARALAGSQHAFHDLASHPTGLAANRTDVCRARDGAGLRHPKISGPRTTC